MDIPASAVEADLEAFAKSLNATGIGRVNLPVDRVTRLHRGYIIMCLLAHRAHILLDGHRTGFIEFRDVAQSQAAMATITAIQGGPKVKDARVRVVYQLHPLQERLQPASAAQQSLPQQQQQRQQAQQGRPAAERAPRAPQQQAAKDPMHHLQTSATYDGDANGSSLLIYALFFVIDGIVAFGSAHDESRDCRPRRPDSYHPVALRSQRKEKEKTYMICFRFGNRTFFKPNLLRSFRFVKSFLFVVLFVLLVLGCRGRRSRRFRRLKDLKLIDGTHVKQFVS